MLNCDLRILHSSSGVIQFSIHHSPATFFSERNLNAAENDEDVRMKTAVAPENGKESEP